MSDPMRLRDGGGELPDDLRSALRKAPRPTGPDSRERAAMLAMAANLGALPPPRISPLAKVGGWKAIGGLGLLIVAGGSVVPAMRARSHVAMNSHVATQTTQTSQSPQTNAAPVSTVAPSNSTPTVIAVPAPTVASIAQPAPVPAPVAAPSASHVETRLARAPSRTLSLRTQSGTSTVALAGAAVEHNVTPASACPVAVNERVTVELEARVLASAMRSLGTEPATTLACIHDLEVHGGPVVLRDEHWFLGFSASRRLGRLDDARRWANALLRGAPDSPYAMRVTRFLDGDR